MIHRQLSRQQSVRHNQFHTEMEEVGVFKNQDNIDWMNRLVRLSIKQTCSIISNKT
jgi:hypothetical protein